MIMTVILILIVIAYSDNDTVAMIFWPYKNSIPKIDRKVGNLEICGKSHLHHPRDTCLSLCELLHANTYINISNGFVAIFDISQWAQWVTLPFFWVDSWVAHLDVTNTHTFWKE